METLRFKTNIKCAGCIAKVTPGLNETVGEGKWSVDLTDPSRVLTISIEKGVANVLTALEKAGYKAEKI